jgi:eukaryotic-like serine/threonine-protein kinase
MSFLSTMKAERLIADIKASGDPASVDARKALSKLASMGSTAVEAIIEALSTSDKKETLAYVEVLTALVDTKTLPLLAKGLSESNPRAVTGIAGALSGSKNYPPSVLLELLSQEGVSKPAVLDVISAQKARFNVRELLTAAYAQEPNEKAAWLKLPMRVPFRTCSRASTARIPSRECISSISWRVSISLRFRALFRISSRIRTS